jgi:Uma2 family endonuclease
MNAHAPTLPSDLPRRTFTVREIEQMCEAGIMLEDERVELIFGELIPMNAKGARHETFRRALLLKWAPLLTRGWHFMLETTLRLSAETFIEPDFLIFPAGIRISELTAATLDLAVEVADSSLSFDLGAKATVYAHFGIRELWVIDAARNRLTVHLAPEDGRYGHVVTHREDALVTPAYAPADFALRLDQLDIDRL